MRLDECDIRPGKVLKVVNNYGAIKASAQGLFAETDDPDLLPPIIPFIVPSATTFSMPHEGDSVWVWYFPSNPQELLYTFRCHVEGVNSDQLDNEYQDVEIQMKRSSENGDVNVNYNDDEGYTVNNGGSKFNVDNKEHDIHISHKDGNAISVTKDGISLGKDGGSQYKAVCGEDLIKVLDKIKSALSAIKTSAASSPYTVHISTALTPVLTQLNDFNSILSNKVTLDK